MSLPAPVIAVKISVKPKVVLMSIAPVVALPKVRLPAVIPLRWASASLMVPVALSPSPMVVPGVYGLKVTLPVAAMVEKLGDKSLIHVRLLSGVIPPMA